MRRVIDLECDLPPDEHGVPRKAPTLDHPPGYGDPERLPPLPGHGFDNYRTIFTARAPEPGPQPQSGQQPEPDGQPGSGGEAAHQGVSLPELVARMERAGIARGVIRGPNDLLAGIVAQYPDRFIGMANLSPHDGMRGVREFERLVHECGLSGLRVSSLYTMIPASDRRYYPLYTKCAELDLPLRIYTAMSYANDRPYDLGHPRHLDQVAMDFPELRIVAGLGGWPWVNEMVALLRRHPNLYADTGSHRPRHFATPGSGWEQFLQFGNTMLQDKIMVGLSREAFGLPYEVLIDEYAALPLKSAVVEKWLYGNAVRFFRLG